MFRTEKVGTVDRTGVERVARDHPSQRSSRRASRHGGARPSADGRRTRRTASVSSTHSPCIYGTNPISLTATPNSTAAGDQNLLGDATWGQVDPPGGKPIPARTHIVNVTTIIKVAFDAGWRRTLSRAVISTAADEFPRVRSASPCPSGPGNLNRGDCHWPFFPVGSC